MSIYVLLNYSNSTIKATPMKNIIFCGLLIATFGLQSQVRVVDSERAISSVNAAWSPNDFLVYSILINSKEITQSVAESPVDFKASIEGQINWSATPGNANEKFVKGTFLVTGSGTPFKYAADLKYDGDKMIPLTSVKAWTSIENVKIKYEVDGKHFELPAMTIYPPPVSSMSSQKALSISGQGRITEKRRGEINIESLPSGTQFEVTEVEIIQDGKTTNSSKLKGPAIGNGRFANNGKIDLQFPTTFDLTDHGSSYQVKVTAKVIGTDDVLTSTNRIVFIDDIPLTILNRPDGFILSVNDGNVLVDKEVNTEGKGELGIRFMSKEYADNVKIALTKTGSLYTFNLSGLTLLPEKSYSNFFYTNNNVDIPPAHLIVKEATVLSNFCFSGVSNDKLMMEFNLPSYVSKSLISLSISNGDKQISVGGSLIITNDPSDNSKFIATIPNSVTNLINKDTIRDFKFTVSYNSKNIYSINIKLFNQTLLNNKIAELTAATAEKPRNRDKEKIANIVSDIVKIGKAVGNSIDDKEVTAAIDELKTGNKDEIKRVMSDIGKWALIVGKLVLPILVAA
jgi:hypothetical protein